VSLLVVDASAILAVIQNERGSDVVEPLLVGASISAVNLSEAVAKMLDRGFPEAEVHEHVRYLALIVHAFDREDALRAGALRRPTRALGLSFADRACLALAKYLGLPVLTADRAWERLELGVEVRLFR
jgi:ribonuclease VapC